MHKLYLSPQPRYSEDIDLVQIAPGPIKPIMYRLGEVLAVVFRDNHSISSYVDDVIYVPKIETIFTAAVEIIPLQLLAYYVAKENNCDIDKPKNLAKSVTVE